jgi:hypothetical protein
VTGDSDLEAAPWRSPRQHLDRRRLDRPINGHSVPIGSRLVLAAIAGLLALVLGACATEEASPATTPAQAGGSTVTLPASLIAAITPFADPDLSVPLVGAFEVALGAGLLVGRFMPVFLAGVALHLSGTFLVLVLRPDVALWTATPAAQRGGRVCGEEPGAAGRDRRPGPPHARPPTGFGNCSPSPGRP